MSSTSRPSSVWGSPSSLLSSNVFSPRGVRLEFDPTLCLDEFINCVPGPWSIFQFQAVTESAPKISDTFSTWVMFAVAIALGPPTLSTLFVSITAIVMDSSSLRHALRPVFDVAELDSLAFRQRDGRLVRANDEDVGQSRRKRVPDGILHVNDLKRTWMSLPV